MKTKIAATAAFIGLALAPAAFADDKFELEFDFSPTEVATEIGAQEVYDELEAMIEDQCEPNTVRDKVRLKAETDLCVETALTQAVEDMDKPEITRIHQSRQG